MSEIGPGAPGGDGATRRVTRTYYVMTALNTFALGHIVSINTLFMIDRGLSTVEWNIANAAYAAAMVVFEIPTGVVADTLGRRVSFLLSIAVLFVGTVGTLLFAHDLLTFAALSVLFGLGYTFASGALEAWAVDALRHHGFRGDLNAVFSKNGMVTAIAMLVATTSGAALGSVDLEIPFIVRAAALVPLAAFVWLRMFDDGYQVRALTWRTLIPEINRTARAGLRFGLGSRPIRLLMIAAVFPSAFFLFGWYSWQPYFIQDLGTITFGSEIVSLAAGISAALLLATAAGNALAPRIGAWAGRRTRALALCLAVTAAAVFIGGAVPALVNPGAPSNFAVALLCFLLMMMLFGVSTPIRQGLINGLIEADERATVLSMDSLVSNIGTTVGVVALGWLAQGVSDAGGLGIGWAWMVGGGLIVISVPVLLAAGWVIGAGDRISSGSAT